MKLFWQLTDDEQHEALHYCADMVIQDILDGESHLEPSNDEENKLKEKLDKSIEHIKTLATDSERVDYLLNDEMISKMIFDIGLDLARSAYYHEDDEISINISALQPDNLEESNEELPPINTNKKISSLN